MFSFEVVYIFLHLQKRRVLGPRVENPTSYLQTPALSRIKSDYDRSSLEAPGYGVPVDCCDVKENNMPIDQESFKCPSVPTGTVSTFLVEQTEKLKDNIENVKPVEDMQYIINPLESTKLEGLYDRDKHANKHLPTGKKMSDMASMSLNLMSPIPTIGEVENGFVLDSYFKNNETPLTMSQTSVVSKTIVEAPTFFKETFVCKKAILDQSRLQLVKSNLENNTDDLTLFIAETPTSSKLIGNNAIVDNTYNKSLNQRTTTDNLKKENNEESRDLKENYSAFEKASSLVKKLTPKSLNSSNNASDHFGKVKMNVSSPHLKINRSLSLQNAVSPNTQLNQSINLISQISTPLRHVHQHHLTHISGSSDSCANASIISDGLGLVSPNSFLEDMKNFQDRKEETTADDKERSIDEPSPSGVLNNSIPHAIMVDHLQSIQAHLNSSGSFISGISSPLKCNTPLKKRRSLSTAFRKRENMRPVGYAEVSMKVGSGRIIDKNRFDKTLDVTKDSAPTGYNSKTRQYRQDKPRKSPKNQQIWVKMNRQPIKRGSKASQSPNNPKNRRFLHGHENCSPSAVNKKHNIPSDHLHTFSAVDVLDCLTPKEGKKCPPVDSTTVVKNSILVDVKQETNLLQDNEKVKDIGIDNRESLKRKSLFPEFMNQGIKDHQTHLLRSQVEPESFGNIIEMQSKNRTAIDRTEEYLELSINPLYKITSSELTMNKPDLKYEKEFNLNVLGSTNTKRITNATTESSLDRLDGTKESFFLKLNTGCDFETKEKSENFTLHEPFDLNNALQSYLKDRYSDVHVSESDTLTTDSLECSNISDLPDTNPIVNKQLDQPHVNPSTNTSTMTFVKSYESESQQPFDLEQIPLTITINPDVTPEKIVEYEDRNSADASCINPDIKLISHVHGNDYGDCDFVIEKSHTSTTYNGNMMDHYKEVRKEGKLRRRSSSMNSLLSSMLQQDKSLVKEIQDCRIDPEVPSCFAFAQPVTSNCGQKKYVRSSSVDSLHKKQNKDSIQQKQKTQRSHLTSSNQKPMRNFNPETNFNNKTSQSSRVSNNRKAVESRVFKKNVAPIVTKKSVFPNSHIKNQTINPGCSMGKEKAVNANSKIRIGRSQSSQRDGKNEVNSAMSRQIKNG